MPLVANQVDLFLLIDLLVGDFDVVALVGLQFLFFIGCQSDGVVVEHIQGKVTDGFHLVYAEAG